jgi:SOS response regulatory protein OraA/RecX
LGQRMNRGRSRIYADLRKRGIDRSLAEESLEEFYNNELERESMIHLLEQNPLLQSAQPEPAAVNKIARKMAQRGFPPGAVMDTIREMTCNKGKQEAE